MNLPESTEPQSQALKAAIENLGGVGRLQEEAQKLARALAPAVDSFKQSLGALPLPSAIDQIRDRMGEFERLKEIQSATLANSERWNQISRSFDSLEMRLPEPISMPRITPLSEHLENALRSQEKRQSVYRRQQSELLSEIAAAGREQNQTMVAISKLQEMLVNESIIVLDAVG